MDEKRKIRLQEGQPYKPTVEDLLHEIERQIREGNRHNAYELSLKATQAAPHNVEAWRQRATLAPSLEERMMSVNRANELDPDYRDRQVGLGGLCRAGRLRLAGNVDPLPEASARLCPLPAAGSTAPGGDRRPDPATMTPEATLTASSTLPSPPFRWIQKGNVDSLKRRSSNPG
jgi:hypothetical protein